MPDPESNGMESVEIRGPLGWFFGARGRRLGGPVAWVALVGMFMLAVLGVVSQRADSDSHARIEATTNDLRDAIDALVWTQMPESTRQRIPPPKWVRDRIAPPTR